MTRDHFHLPYATEGPSPLFPMLHWTNFLQPLFPYCFTSSTLRFFAFPSSVSFVATGAYGPLPNDLSREAAIPCVFTSASITAPARFWESFMFDSSVPTL